MLTRVRLSIVLSLRPSSRRAVAERIRANYSDVCAAVRILLADPASDVVRLGRYELWSRSRFVA